MYTDYYLHCKLEQLFQEHRLVSLITLLRGSYFFMCLFMFCILLKILIGSKRVRSLVFIWFINISTMRKYSVYIVSENSSGYFCLFRCCILWKHWTSLSPRSLRATYTSNRLHTLPRRLLFAATAHRAPMGKEHSRLNWLQRTQSSKTDQSPYLTRCHWHWACLKTPQTVTTPATCLVADGYLQAYSLRSTSLHLPPRTC